MICLFESKLYSDMVVALLIPMICNMDLGTDAISMGNFGGASNVSLPCSELVLHKMITRVAKSTDNEM